MPSHYTSGNPWLCRAALWPARPATFASCDANAMSPPMSAVFVDAEPYPWPYDGNLKPSNTALLVIDMQVDFCGKGGYVDCMGYDLALTRAPIAPIRDLLAGLRPHGFLIIHT